MGVSRATAQRYLALLSETGQVELTLRYGGAGRPEHRYGCTEPDCDAASATAGGR